MTRAWIVTIALLGAPLSASAHGFEVGVLALEERTPGRFSIAWRPPEDSRRVTPARVTIRFPPHCRREHHELRCGAEGLHGVIAFDDVPDPRTPIVVRVDRLDGRRIDAVLRGEAPEVDVGRASATLAALEAGAREVVAVDHLLVLFAIVLVAGVDRRALPALAAFVCAHAVGLALDGAGLPNAPLAATLGAGVVLLARQGVGAHEPRRALALFAALLGFGLGLAQGDARSAPAIASAALADVAVLALVASMARLSQRRAPRLRVASAYALGAGGALWLLERGAAIVTATW